MSDQKNTSGSELDRVLFEGQISSVAVTVFQNELPPCGLLGILDWHFRGAISQYIQQGAITGRVGECTYFPVTRNQSTYHLILAGAGYSEVAGQRATIPNETLQALQTNLISLKFSKTAVSKADFGNVSSDFFYKHLKGVSLWIAP
jgi:hypothetical protein